MESGIERNAGAQSDLDTGELMMIPGEYSQRLFYSGMLTIVSVAVSLNLGLYTFSLIGAAVLVNSINYWRYPIAGPRRNIDMAFAIGACLYHMQASFGLESEPYFTAYWIVTSFALYSYAVARRYGRRHNNPDMASRWHMSLHVFGNVSNVILYLGLSPIEWATLV